MDNFELGDVVDAINENEYVLERIRDLYQNGRDRDTTPELIGQLVLSALDEWLSANAECTR